MVQISTSSAMDSLFRVWCYTFAYVLLISTFVTSYEKTLRKIVRNQSKMVQTPFSENRGTWKNASMKSIRYSQALLYPGVSQAKAMYHNLPKMSKIMSAIETGRPKSALSRMNMITQSPIDRLTRNTFTESVLLSSKSIFFNQDSHEMNTITNNVTIKNFYQLPVSSKFFPPIEDHDNSYEHKRNGKDNSVIIPNNRDFAFDNGTIHVKGILVPRSHKQTETVYPREPTIFKETHKLKKVDPIFEDHDLLVADLPMDNKKLSYNISTDPFSCTVLQEVKTDINAQEIFTELNIEPPWMNKKLFWNNIFEARYETLMRNPKWPPLKVILIPHTHVDTIWKKTFKQYHLDSVSKILSNIVKKLQFYERLTFTWNEVSHLSYWWKNASHKTRSAFRKLVKEGRLEITTGGWVQSDEATIHLFGLVHQLIEGHRWLKRHLNYSPKVAWLTNTVSHSPTMVYLLTELNIYQAVLTNIHYSWEEYLAKYQYSDFIWLQHWDLDRSYPSKLNDDLGKMGNDQYPKHAVLTHYLQFNSASFNACGPNIDLCSSEYNFARPNKNLDINSYNLKDKAEQLLEQYSKTGTISSHNTIIAPIGGPFFYEMQPEFDYQYNNYARIADFVNTNKDIYKATINFGTVQDYFTTLTDKHKNYPTLKGDFLNFADIRSGRPAYWTGYYTSRPFTKILLSRLQSTLRSTEILFSFALNYNVFRGYNLRKIFELLMRSRETFARLMDRNVVSGTVSANALKYVHNQILSTVKDCWYIQELSASFLTLKPEQTMPYLQKYVYRDGEFISVFKSVSPGDQIYIFNSLSNERTEIVEIVTRLPNIRIMDHNNKDVIIQINPIWKYNSDNIIKLSQKFFKISFPVMIPPMTLALFKIKQTYDATFNAATLYCLACIVDEARNGAPSFPFDIQPIQPGDIQLESYKYRLIFDEITGFLKTVVEKETNTEKTVFIDYGAFRDSNFNSGMFLFNTNVSQPLQNIFNNYRLGKIPKVIMIVSGQVTTELVTIYGRLLQHTTKIFNLLNNPMSNAISIESKVDYEVSPKNRELEVFLSIQTDIQNGNPPQIFIDNNSYQYTPRVLNISRRIESNMYPITSMAFIQDTRARFTFVTDHPQGVTALQEGQLVVMLDRRVLYDDGRGTKEGLADSTATCHRHYILLENIFDNNNNFGSFSSHEDLTLPSLNAFYLANTINYLLDVFIIEKNHTNLCYYMFLPLIKTAFPCDVSLLNYRAILDRGSIHNFTPNSALMILHRQSYSCKIAGTLSQHCHADSNFVFDKLFRNVKTVYQTNLAGTIDGNSISNLNLDNFPPMVLRTLRIDF